MGNVPLLAYALPFFFGAMGLEFCINARLRLPNYRFEDWISNLSLGVGQQALSPLFKAGELACYGWLVTHAARTHVQHTVWGWLGVFLAMDLSYYLFHRCAHRIGALWAVHAVHHQSEDFNLGVALRQAWLEPVISAPFRLPWAFVGLPLDMVVVAQTLITVYQFWVHVRCVRSLGWVERLLVCPAHHRVHHAVNPDYIDKNFGGLLIVWDRLFGTFAAEAAPPVFGTSKPLRSWQPLWANLAEFWYLGAPGPRWWHAPGWQPETSNPAPATVDLQRAPWAPRSRRRLAALMALAATLALGCWYVVARSSWPIGWQVVVAALLLTAVSGIGRLLEVGMVGCLPLRHARS